MALTDTAIRNARPKESVQKLSDGGGLQLWINPNGSKLWRLAYRYADKQKKLFIGLYAVISLAKARQERNLAKALLAAGVDPGQQKKMDQLAASASHANTFELIAAELLAKKRKEGKASNTIGKREWLYRLAGKAFNKCAISQITAPEVLAVLRKVENKGLHETARRMRSSMVEVFRFAVATARAEMPKASAIISILSPLARRSTICSRL